jgi:hypothetical protein
MNEQQLKKRVDEFYDAIHDTIVRVTGDGHIEAPDAEPVICALVGLIAMLTGEVHGAPIEMVEQLAVDLFAVIMSAECANCKHEAN